MSTLISELRAIAVAMEQTWNVEVRRADPRYLRASADDMPFAALGWISHPDMIDGGIGELADGSIFLAGYFASDEKSLLDAVDLLPDIADLVADFTFANIERSENDEGIDILDHAFAFEISKET